MDFLSDAPLPVVLLPRSSPGDPRKPSGLKRASAAPRRLDALRRPRDAPEAVVPLPPSDDVDVAASGVGGRPVKRTVFRAGSSASMWAATEIADESEASPGGRCQGQPLFTSMIVPS